MHLSVFALEVSVFENLVLSGADCNMKNKEGNTVLHVLMNLFATNPDVAETMLRILIQNNQGTLNMNPTNKSGWSPTHYAAKSGN